MKKILIFLTCCWHIFSTYSFAQNFNAHTHLVNDSTENATSNNQSNQVVFDWLNMVAAGKVKQVDEFIERFNGDTTSQYYQYRLKKFPDYPLTRAEFILGLLNNEKNDWNRGHLSSFVKTVTNRKNPFYINFTDSNWFALLNCKVQYKGSSNVLDLVLNLESDGKGSFRWVIKGVNAKFLTFPIHGKNNLGMHPNTVSVNFLDLYQLFEEQNKDSIKGFFSKAYSPDIISLFIQEVQKMNIKIESVSKISFHYMQVPNWIFIVRKFQRNTPNSGWLIDDVFPITENDKDIYLTEKLYISN